MNILPGFRRVLEHVANVYRSRRDEVEEASTEIQKALATQLRPRRRDQRGNP